MTPRLRQQTQRGLGLVELMVGITIGLIISAAASMMAVNQISEHRRLMLETQIQQDLRTAADLIQQDIRRAGARGWTGYGVWAPASGAGSAEEIPAMAASANAFSAITVSTDKASIRYSYKSDPDNKTSDVPGSKERFGIGYDAITKALYFQIGDGGRQPLTDPDTVKITSFLIDESTEELSLDDFCDKSCVATGCTPPKQQVRRLNISLQGEAKHDPRVVRTLNVVERIRADHITGSCPT